MRIAAALIGAAVALSAAGSASGQGAVGRVVDEKQAGGSAVRVAEESGTVHRVLLGDRVLYVNRDSASVGIQGVYEAGGRAFALISEASGGNACPSMYRAVEVTNRGLVSPQFGTCSDTPRRVAVEDGALVVVLPRMDGQANEVFRYSAGRLAKTVQATPYQPGGPAAAPYGDLAALVDGKYIFDAARMKLVADALRRVTGEAMFTASRRRVEGGVGVPFESRGEFVVARSCQAHLCGTNETAWAFDHLGHAWASWKQDGRTSFFGNPPPGVRAALAE